MSSDTGDRSASAPGIDAQRRRRRLIGGAIGAVVLVLGYFIGAAFLPRWWAHLIGNRVNGSLVTGTLLGLVLGFVFTAVPLVVARQALRKGLQRRTRAVIVVLAAVIAVPNLLTLGISLGTGNGAHAGRRILDNDGDGFRWATLIGAIVAAVAVGLAFAQLAKHRHDKARTRADRAELARLRKAGGTPPDPPADRSS